MKLVIEYNGKTYQTAYQTVNSSESTMKESIDALYNHFEDLVKLKLDMEDGSTMIVGKDVIQNAVFLVVP